MTIRKRCSTAMYDLSDKIKRLLLEVNQTDEPSLINNITEIAREQPLQIITANPEIIMLATEHRELCEAFLSNDSLIVADGVGVVWGAKKAQGVDEVPLMPGVELAQKLISETYSNEGSIFLYGAKAEVLTDLIDILCERFPGINIVGRFNGYDSNQNAVKEQLISLEPDLVLVALGSPAQDEFIFDVIPHVSRGIYIGVGGTFDAMSGHSPRAPKVFRKLKLEWLYRTITQPKRIKRLLKYHVPYVLAMLRK